MKKTLFLIVVLSYSTVGFSQSFENGDLDGTISGGSDLPTAWQAVYYNDPICNANFSAMASPDLTNLVGPDSIHGVMGNPYSGYTFISGIDGSLGSFYWHEGIRQTVSGFIPETNYSISFYQTVVRQESFLDISGSWAVYLDTNLIAVTTPSLSTLPFNSTNLVWDNRIVNFTATSNSHTIKFLPLDDDDNSEGSTVNLDGGLRMGIDDISILTTTIGYDEIENSSLSVYPNPMTESLNIDLKRVYQNIDIEVIDTRGKVVLMNTYTNSKNIEFDFNGVQGIYFLRVNTDSGMSYNFKIIKE